MHPLMVLKYVKRKAYKLNFNKIIEKLDILIRQAEFEKVTNELLKLKEQNIPRRHISQLANIARRGQNNDFALEILNPIIRPQTPLESPANIKEMAEYGASLTRAGVLNESINILESLDHSNNPEVLLYRCINHFQIWEYEKAIPLLHKYLDSSILSDYQALVGKVNLVSSYMFLGKGSEIKLVLDEIINEASLRGHNLLYSIILQLSAQDKILNEQFDLAKSDLTESEKALKGSQHISAFYLKKWQAILNLLKSKGDKNSVIQIKKIQHEAGLLKNWETIRECDFYLSYIHRNDELFNQVYLGTPYVQYRKRVSEIYKPNFQIPTSIKWTMNNPHSNNSYEYELDVNKGKLTSQVSGMKVGQVMHKSLFLLTRDFYKPIQVGELFSQLFQDDHFNPTTSPERVFKAIGRLRNWLKENNIPIKILRTKGEYRLSGGGNCCLIISTEEKNLDRFDLQITELFKEFSYLPFTVADACKVLGLASRTTSRLIKKAMENNNIEKNGKGKATKYKFRKNIV